MYGLVCVSSTVTSEDDPVGNWKKERKKKKRSSDRPSKLEV